MATKSDLVSALAREAQLTQAQARTALTVLPGVIAAALKENEEVRLPGLGTFKPVDREARKGRNPFSGETIDIPAKRGVKFKAGKDLLTAVAPAPTKAPDRRAPRHSEQVASAR
jgi:DNA-binding protein HU-beta